MSSSELFAPPPSATLLRPSSAVPRRRSSLRPIALADHRPPSHSLHRSPEPPWLVHPPPPPVNPFSSSPPLSLRLHHHHHHHRLPSPPPTAPPPDTPVSRAVSSLLFMIGELQRPAFEGQEALDRVSRDRRDSFVWLFRRVFSNSPNLVPLVLLLLSQFIAVSAQRAAEVPELREEEGERDETEHVETVGHDRPAVEWNYRSWFDVGIREGELEEGVSGDAAAATKRRRRVYERAIAEGEVNSLLLCNYAQLLYRIERDHDRAEHYFKWASMAEPRDAEAIGRYAIFTWEASGDIARAEELFLEAIEVDPDSFYHSSNYAWFLWKTGAEDTCFPLTPPM